MNRIIAEALSDELKAALQAAGHDSPIIQSGLEADDTVMIHNNTRHTAGSDVIFSGQTPVYSGRKEGPYRITFLDRAPSQTHPSGYEEAVSPAHHLTYDKPEDAVRHLGIIKKLYKAGVPNQPIIDFLKAGDTPGFHYNKSNPKARGNIFSLMQTTFPTENDAQDAAFADVKSSVPMEEPSRKKQTSAYDSVIALLSGLGENYSAKVEALTAVLLETTVVPISHYENIREQDSPKNYDRYQMSYRKLAQIATAMGAAGAAYTPD